MAQEDQRPAEPKAGTAQGRSGEGAASAMEHMLSQQLAHTAQTPRDDTHGGTAPPQPPQRG